MGLDMYLFRRKKLRENDEEYNNLVMESQKEVMYWRKANQVRQWFVDHTELEVNDNCRDILVSKETLEQLRNDCATVLTNHSKSTELMPTSSGFFFGGTEYDEWYYLDLKNTVEAVDQILTETDFDTEDIIYTEWW